MGSLDGFAEVARQAVVWAVPLLAAVILHEIAHGYVALRFGDDTAKRAGRLTLNPIPHIDPIGTLVIPGVLLFSGSPWLFGYARPVPVDFSRLRDPRRGMVWVALAGPLTNLVLAVGFAFVLHRAAAGMGLTPLGALHELVNGASLPLVELAWLGMQINVILALVNMLPVPPLDGGRVLVGLLPVRYARMVAQVEPVGMVILIVLLMSGGLSLVLDWPRRVLLGALL